MRRKLRQANLHKLVEEYLALRATGMGAEQALHEFDWLHPIMLSRLRKLIGALPVS